MRDSLKGCARARRAPKRSLIATAAGVAALALSAGSAAAAPTGIYAPFAQCPTNVPDLATCVVSDTTSGYIKLGNSTVTIDKRIRLQGGYTVDPVTYENTFYGAKNGETLERVELDVPGGLLGITTPELVPEPARSLLNAAINTTNGVTATAELVGPVGFSFANIANADGIGVTLPIRVKLNNPFLGGSCYIGSARHPITLNLTDGTTIPPAGVAPMVGDPGTLDFFDNANLIVDTGVSLVDNTFAVPTAHGCGGLLALVIDPVINLKVGLPSAAGVSEARMTGTSSLAAAAAVIASDV